MKDGVKGLGAYVLILVVFLLLLGDAVSALKNEINTTVRVQCQSGNTSAILGKYNDAIQVLINEQKAAERINLAAGRASIATLDASTAARLQGDQIPIVKQDCSKPLLP